jgi:flagellin
MTMAISSINTNIAAFYAQANISSASSLAQSSVSRLSSGNRIVQASDDVAALSIGTSLQTQVSALKQALTNASQGISLLQVADGALAQIQAILQQQKSIALQAGSGSLTDTDRGFLNQQFQALSSQINTLTSSTTFNGVGLIDGSLTQTVGVDTTSTLATKGSTTLNFTTISATDDILINGVTLSAETTPGAAGAFQIGSDLATTVANLANYLNNAQNDNSTNALSAANKLLVSGATYSAVGNILTITARAGGSNFTFVAEDSAGTGLANPATYTIVGNGTNSISQVQGIAATSLDVDIVDSLAAGDFTTGALTLDGVTVATLTAADTLRTIVNKINDATATTGATAFITGTTGAYQLNIRTINDAQTGTIAGAALNGLTQTQTTGDGTEVVTGGLNDGLGFGSVTATGSTGGATSILTDQSQAAASGGYNFNDIADGNLVSTLSGLNFVVAGITFTFTTNTQAAGAQNEVAIGSTLEETLDNAVAKVNAFSSDADTNYQFNQFTASRDGTRLSLTANVPGGVLQVDGTTATTFTIGSLGSNASVFGSFAAPTNTGVDLKGVVNADFVGSIGGLTATYVSANTIDLSITVGGSTYTAQNVDTNPTTDTKVRLISTNGGYFDIQLRGSYGEVVSNQAGADTFAARINAALEGLTLSQDRIISSYDAGVGTLAGSTVSLNSTSFSNVKVTDISVIAPSGSNSKGSVIFTIGGEAYTASVELGGQIGANSVVKFVSAGDPNKFLTFRNGANDLDISTAGAAAALQTELRSAFGVGEGAEALSFQLGTSSTSNIAVSLDAATTTNIFGGQSLSVATASAAATASDVLDDAIATVASIRANVGALQTQFNFASASLQSSVQNQDAARGQLLDTDIAAESTSYATSQVKLQAGISVLAQANQQLQALLKLIG